MALTGWTIDSGDIDHIGSFWTAQDGSQSIDLNGFNPGSISQNLNGLSVGSDYIVSFWLAGNAASSATKTLEVSVGGTPEAYSYVQATITMDWVLKTFAFTATSTTQTLRFSSTTALGNGPALDNISIAAASTGPGPSVVPLPASAWLLIGAVGGLAPFRRRRC